MSNDRLIGTTIENYRIDRMLGQGGMATVYEATDLKLQRKVAIKIMHPHIASQKNFQQRFLQEARAAASLDHPNIVRVLSFNNIDNMLFLVMELITGGNLRRYVKLLDEEARFIGYHEAAKLVQQLADALDYAHNKGMIHRDVKPDNVVLKSIDSATSDLNYRPVLTDFGLAKLTGDGEDAITDQQPIGTYPYMSPEQCLAEGVDLRSDIYSLGIVLYELAIGRLPFVPKTIAEAVRMHGRDPLVAPSTLRRGFPEDLEQIIIRCLKKSPRDRYSSAAELAVDLKRFLNKKAVNESLATAETAVISQPEPEEFSTDLSTAAMTSPLPEEVPDHDIDMSDDLLGYDWLIFYSEDHPMHQFIVTDDIINVGRGDDQHVVLDGEKVSRSHAQIERKPNGKYYITDLGSTNGTWVAHKRLAPHTPAILRTGLIARLGDYWLYLIPKQDVVATEPQPVEQPLDIPAIQRNTQEQAAIHPDKPALEVPAILRDTQEQASINFDEPVVKPEKIILEEDAGPDTDHMRRPLPADMPYFSSPPVTPDQLGFARLVFYSDSQPIVVAKLNKDIMTIGSAKNQDIVLQGEWVSRQHARIERSQEGNFYLIDVGSTNGIWMGDEKVESNLPVILSSSRIIRIGEYWGRFEVQKGNAAQLPGLTAAQFPTDGRDVNATVRMIRPLSEDMPHFSPPPLSIEQQTVDRVTFYSEDHPLQIIALNKEILTVGRDVTQDIVLEGMRVSRKHLRLELRSDGHIYVTDLDSVNGTWMGDTLLVPQTKVLWPKHEVIRLGNYWMKFERGTQDFDAFAGATLLDDRGLVGKTIKDYRVDRYLGSGNLASVYKATDLTLDRSLALKIVHPNLAAQPLIKQRFLQEARVASRLEHPNIVHVLTYDDVDGELFMVMELIPGGSLRRYLNELKQDLKRMELDEVVEMGVQMADGLHYAHQQGMIHRDIRPESIVLKPGVVIGPIVNYQPILTDFALARSEDSGQLFITDKPDVSFAYMSPEQCLGERVDVRSDIYELAIILYEMATGAPPYQPRSIAEAVRMHARAAIPRPSESRPDLPLDIEKVLMRALEKDPNNRYQNASELSRALRRAAADYRRDSEVSSYPDEIIEDQLTVVMDEAIPPEMPFATRPPITQREHDRLILYSEKFPTQAVQLNKEVFTIGRDSDQDIVLDSPKVSRRHARIERGFGGTYRISDLGSKNGAWLGNYRLIPNVTEIWDIEETVRIGDYWLRIEDVSQLQVPDYIGTDDGDEYETDGGADGEDGGFTDDSSLLGQSEIGITVNNAHVRVAAGSSAAIAIEVVNQSTIVDHFEVTVEGLPSEWVTQSVRPLYLLPHNRDTTSITFHPPLASTSSAGEHAFEIRVAARAQHIFSIAEQGSLTIEPYRTFVTDLQPSRVKGRRMAELTLTNRGNIPGVYAVEARDREQAALFDVMGKHYTLPPGYKERIPIRVAPKSRPLIGSAQTIPFEVIVSPIPEDAAGGPQTQAGELIVRPYFPVWTIAAIIILFMLCGIASMFAYTTFRNNIDAQKTETAIALATQADVTLTAVAMADTDNDTLPNHKEAEYGTDPTIADTDEDGLLDGEEVRVWLTDPTLRDTDGDTLTDGDEVNIYGTDPLNPDTDGDGIPDNEDIAPTTQSTGTPTPFPTLVGSNGDICAGSPMPSKMTVGIDAIVEYGGVRNRLRDMPGKLTGAVIDYMEPGAGFKVVGGPECDPEEQIRWWQVDFNGTVGWTAEGEGEEYYLALPGEGGGPSLAGGAIPSESVTSANIEEVAKSLDGGLMGIQLNPYMDADSWSRTLDMADALGVQWIKVQASWSVLEPDYPGQFDPDFEQFQKAIQTAKIRGYKVLLSVVKAPAWARAIREEDGPPDDPQEYAKFMGRLLDKVGPVIDAIEIWNEPNLQREWVGNLPFSGEGYMQLFVPAYERIRAYSTSITIVTAGLAPTITQAISIDDQEYLKQMYAAGLADYLDNIAIGLHPYGWANAADTICCDAAAGNGWDDSPKFYFLDTINKHRAIMTDAGHGSVPVWITEFGWATWEGFPGAIPEEWMASNTLESQANNAIRAFQIGQARDDVGIMFLWNLNYGTQGLINQSNEIAAYSILVIDDNNNFSPRPLYNALSARGSGE